MLHLYTKRIVYTWGVTRETTEKREDIQRWGIDLGANGYRALTPAVVLIVELSVHEGAHLLKVLLRVVEGILEGAELVPLVRAPLALVGEGEDAKRVGECRGDLGQEGADGVIITHISLCDVLPRERPRRHPLDAVVEGVGFSSVLRRHPSVVPFGILAGEREGRTWGQTKKAPLVKKSLA